MTNEEIIKTNFPPETIYSETIDSRDGLSLYTISYSSPEKITNWLGEISKVTCQTEGKDFNITMENFQGTLISQGWNPETKQFI